MVPQQAAAHPIQVLTFDGKGVVRRKEGLREETRKRAEARAPKAPRGLTRQETSHRTRMATVAGMYHIDRPRRSAQTVAPQVASLRLVPRHRRTDPKPVGKQRWASLHKSMHTVIETGFAEAQRRDPTHRAAWVVVVDGDLTQIDDSEQAADACGVRVVIIVDIMHVLASLWKAAKAWLPSDDPTIAQWVSDITSQLLPRQVKSIVRTLRRGATAKRMRSKQREPIDQCANYVANHAAYLNYPTYLAQGYPIATGVIEGACRPLVKDRMEITGARWGLEGGEAVLKLRALVINGDFDAYWDFHEQQEYQRNHRVKFAEMSSVPSSLQLISGGKDS